MEGKTIAPVEREVITPVVPTLEPQVPQLRKLSIAAIFSTKNDGHLEIHCSKPNLARSSILGRFEKSRFYF